MLLVMPSEGEVQCISMGLLDGMSVHLVTLSVCVTTPGRKIPGTVGPASGGGWFKVFTWMINTQNGSQQSGQSGCLDP